MGIQLASKAGAGASKAGAWAFKAGAWAFKAGAWAWLLFLVGALWSGFVGGCSQERVDCKSVCRRMFRQCPAEVLGVREKIGRDQLARMRAGPALKAFGRKGHAACMKSCSTRSGRGSDAAAINRCMKRAGCEAFARCLAPYLR